MKEHHPNGAGGQASTILDRELAAKEAVFGTAKAQGYLPAALTLLVGQPAAVELLEAEEFLVLAALEVRRWRRAVEEPLVAAGI